MALTHEIGNKRVPKEVVQAVSDVYRSEVTRSLATYRSPERRARIVAAIAHSFPNWSGRIGCLADTLKRGVTNRLNLTAEQAELISAPFSYAQDAAVSAFLTDILSSRLDCTPGANMHPASHNLEATEMIKELKGRSKANNIITRITLSRAVGAALSGQLRLP
ncbi:hypothetical protein HY025_03925 [Candidatus Daviesbacteria bacterium]|nr:hypothetical protein [Candidatus Daviesbacteria bacterium]